MSDWYSLLHGSNFFDLPVLRRAILKNIHDLGDYMCIYVLLKDNLFNNNFLKGDSVLPDIMSWPEDYIVQYLYSEQEKNLYFREALTIVSLWLPSDKGVHTYIHTYIYIYKL